MRTVWIALIGFLIILTATLAIVIQKPVHEEDLAGYWKSVDGSGFDIQIHDDGTFSLKGHGIGGILSVVKEKLTGHADELKGRWNISYNPFTGNRLILDFSSGETQHHEVTLKEGILTLSGQRMVRQIHS
ncbi:MAG TPA: hypothetical protein PK014_01350 [Thermoanaerobaculia bacterium]|nr:hypothetical protein [Thermoanaerobaculia bacterium]HUM28660.1 hypothetical protein [Thermoanaerobaculia bacterium]HXK66732.1 hypothetical protein [Thermoanaerobaculia bacterium]